MKKVWIFVVLWVGLGFFNYGTVNADWAWVQRHDFCRLHHSQRSELGFMVEQSVLIPPLELVTSSLLSNFWEHGWDPTSTPWKERKCEDE